MKKFAYQTSQLTIVTATFVLVISIGCSSQPTTSAVGSGGNQNSADEHQHNEGGSEALVRLSSEDEVLAKAQSVCPVTSRPRPCAAISTASASGARMPLRTADAPGRIRYASSAIISRRVLERRLAATRSNRPETMAVVPAISSTLPARR